MKGKVNFYCDFSFLKKFYKSPPRYSLIEENYSEHWHRLAKLFLSDKLFIIDSSEEKLSLDPDNEDYWEQAKNILLQLYGEGKTVCIPEEKRNMEISIADGAGESYFENTKNTIFFFDKDTSYCKQLEEDFGLLFFSIENYLSKIPFLFSEKKISIDDSEEFKDWKFLKEYKHPCNFIMIVDSYFYEASNLMEKNLRSILLALMPEKLNHQNFHIKLISKDDGDSSKQKNRKEKINNIIEKIESELSYKIHIDVIFRRDLHDRFILTNYGIIDSGYGFNLKDLEKKKGTKVHFYPITQDEHSTYSINYSKLQIE